MKNAPFANLSFSKNDQTLINVERAISDMRRGVPVVVTDEAGSSIVLATEAIGQHELEQLAQSSPVPLALILTNKRARFVFPDIAPTHTLRIENTNWSIEQLHALSGMIPSKETGIPSQANTASPLENKAIALAKLAELLPSVVVAGFASAEAGITYAAINNLLVISSQAITEYKQAFAFAMKEICRTPLRLETTENAALVAFRALASGREHYAIIIGNPTTQDAPLVRIHSSCYTGDLLGSLHCDCGDQLKEAIRFMAANEGGIILYLMQEGRGIGLTNKLRSYALQAQGLDTVDANEILGFDDDERLFRPAAKMLEVLEIQQVTLLTNNPRKAKGLEDNGIKVAECMPHIMVSNKHNQAYLHTKATRLGHNFPSDKD